MDERRNRKECEDVRKDKKLICVEMELVTDTKIRITIH